MIWNMNQFRTLCINRGLPDSTEFQETLVLKQERVFFFSEKSQKVWNDLFSSQMTVTYPSEEWSNTWLESAAYIEASLQSLHSMADVLAQILNLVFFNPALAESAVSLRRINRSPNSNNLVPNVQTAIQNLIDSNEFKYVDAFVNVIKHRRLLDTDYQAEGGTGLDFRMGLRIKPFDYNQDHFAYMWVKEDIIENTIPGFISKIADVGNEVNNYLM